MSNLHEINLDSGNVKELNISSTSNPINSTSDFNITRGSSPPLLNTPVSSPRPNLVVDGPPSFNSTKEVPMQGLELLADSKKFKTNNSPPSSPYTAPPSEGVNLDQLNNTIHRAASPTLSATSATSVHSNTSVQSGQEATDNILKFLDDTPGPSEINNNVSDSGINGTTETENVSTPSPPKTFEEIQREKQVLLHKFERLINYLCFL